MPDLAALLRGRPNLLTSRRLRGSDPETATGKVDPVSLYPINNRPFFFIRELTHDDARNINNPP
jgi:hypothetical protein